MYAAVYSFLTKTYSPSFNRAPFFMTSSRDAATPLDNVPISSERSLRSPLAADCLREIYSMASYFPALKGGNTKCSSAKVEQRLSFPRVCACDPQHECIEADIMCRSAGLGPNFPPRFLLVTHRSLCQTVLHPIIR